MILRTCRIGGHMKGNSQFTRLLPINSVHRHRSHHRHLQQLKQTTDVTIRTYGTTSNHKGDKEGTVGFGNTKVPDFSDTQEAYASMTTPELVRSAFILKLASLQWLVRISERLLILGHRLFPALTDGVVRRTFFAHFCAGEDEHSIAPRVSSLYDKGVGSILDYAAEADIEENEAKDETGTSHHTHSGDEVVSHPVGRVYEYKDEKACDGNRDIFLKAVRAVHNVSPEGFAAVKVTALGNPLLLQRMTQALFDTEFGLWKMFNTNEDGYVTWEEFQVGYKKYFKDNNEENMLSLFKRLDEYQDAKQGIDFIEWTKTLSLEDLLTLVDSEKQPALANLLLDREEIKLMNKMLTRLDEIVKEAHRLEVRVMIDAEHSYFQPAIDKCVLQLQRKYNTGRTPVVFHTYQAYLKDSFSRLQTDLKRANREGFWLAAKVVRGAYMVLERQRAKEMGYASPIQETLQDTHKNYEKCITEILTCIKHQAPRAELMVATHNQSSVELTIRLMQQLDLSPARHVYFGQLLGMADHLTFALGRAGYKAYKYVPYGPVREVMPYLIRRGIENSDMMSGSVQEQKNMTKEVLRRVLPF
eukprot:gb/GEZN01002924.1/.p1 GENE.gb/GEZN01002924.1/~~gb/GEZN01002924.1/.p1  ORF type:complete len:585 (+),score=74.19 gb/GEZN01002924.1/:47-1801(+)